MLVEMNSEQREKLERLLREYQELPEFMGMNLTGVNQRGTFDSPPLNIAIYRGRLEEVKTFLEAGANVNASGEFGERALQVAINMGDAATIELLLSCGARCDLDDGHGDNAWEWADCLNFAPQFEEIVRRVAPDQLRGEQSLS